MSNKEFIKERIRIYAGKDFDLMSDEQVCDILKTNFNVSLPQRPTLNKSLSETNNEHEIISLILQYRTTT